MSNKRYKQIVCKCENIITPNDNNIFYDTTKNGGSIQLNLPSYSVIRYVICPKCNKIIDVI